MTDTTPQKIKIVKSEIKKIDSFIKKLDDLKKKSKKKESND